MMTNKYTARIPAYHCQFPKYYATVNAVTEAFSRQQDSIRGIVLAFDLDNAIGAQLDVIGLWVGRGRRIRAPTVNHYFSFDVLELGFDLGSWRGRYDSGDAYIDLDDDTYRTVLRAKIGANNWDGTVETLPAVLAAIYPDGGIEISFTDNLDMSMTVTARGAVIPAITKEIIRQGYLSIKPMGIAVNYDVVEG
ncbi:Protein of uncharacterised function (DUF2612) [Serratia ficaria]|uniref:DUF2612 domain-containing protein n=2 Tax=Serratia ficaria TaxID=61651 RepID=UPI00217B933A|nr:DUF2612 domain-containing protein [Serratia ficaria]CAI1019412.1 Protein of uncharacterised function (DUF2612) [Serratia ficaria]CAI1864099.1 Protein of uncharacterised function (DUF2612) [Serratia ficaria]CAI2470917.1 Protein of uncharacterised function (DUF2612) [Serratia ficaria]CAI2792115.1 Protein of uncharacterised function (DUF2612) [Serratia ficaria]